eukprot:comp20656_c0_seq1/m.26804 comp20656_c0_seq1/g.26804  ORF comp20656_c0_seq1/g.26804 comp20656_c0_seq1/m.26804 type:complete len:826 (-) comp20656_c0_seq1:144-2621(-)
MRLGQKSSGRSALEGLNMDDEAGHTSESLLLHAEDEEHTHTQDDVELNLAGLALLEDRSSVRSVSPNSRNRTVSPNNTTTTVTVQNSNNKTASTISHVTFHNVRYWVKGIEVLKGVSGYVPGGQLLAIIGPSGAGKSTLLDILANRSKQGEVTGKVLTHYVDGRPPTDMLQPGISSLPIGGKFQQLSGYITQEDTFIPNLTVRETMQYAQALRGKKGDNKEIDRILMTLKLTKVANTRVGSQLDRGVSGGEARRLSIAVGLLISPGILFIDEPTTNLDSYAALKVMQTVKNLCQNGHTVVCSIHQPRSNIYDMFDFLLVLESGRPLYFGGAQGAVGYFRERLGRECPMFHNPADFMLDMLEEDKDEDMRRQEQANGGTSSSTTGSPLNLRNRSPRAIRSSTETDPESGAFGKIPEFEIENSEDDDDDDAELLDVGSDTVVKLTRHTSRPKTTTTNQKPPLKDSPSGIRAMNRAIANADIAPAQSHPPRTGSDVISGRNGVEVHPKISDFPAVWKSSPERKHMLHVLEGLDAMEKRADFEHRGGAMSRWFKESTSVHTTQINFGQQLLILLSRAWVDKRRNKVQMYLRTLGALFISFFLGIIFFHTEDNWHVAWNRVNTINFSVTVFTLFSLPAISKFIDDRLIVWRERESGCYTTLAYYLAVVGVETLILLMMTVAYGSICYWMVGMDPGAENFAYFLTVLFLVINISCAICQAIAAVVQSVPFAVCLYMIVVAYMLMFGGFIIQPDQMPSWIQWIVQTSFYFHSAQGLFVNEFENRVYGKNVQKWLGVMYPYNKWYYFEVLIVYFIVVRVLAFILLNYWNKERR